MACQYWVKDKWVSEEQFKEMLNNGLLDHLIHSGKMEMKGFKTSPKKVAETIIHKTFPVKKLVDILANEISTGQSYPLDMLSALELNAAGTDFKIPLWSSPYAEKFESLLTSVVTKNIIKHKMPGHSYVLGSEEGFKVKVGEDANKLLKQSGIVFTDSFNPEIGLLPVRLGPNGKLLPAQVMIPFGFKDSSGKKLKLKDYTKTVDGRTVLDMDKIDPKILKLFGFRIPTQGHNSMASIEIVGFLPEKMGDLILAPRDFTVQMGSDFDVDKLYTYSYNIKVDENGGIHTNIDESETEDYLQNKIIDVHHSVLENPKLLPMILSPDSFGDYENIANDVYSIRKKSSILTPLSGIYQRTKYINASMGKSGCLGLDTEVLMFDGRFKKVQDITVGDQLMGIDSTPRNVLSLKRGVEQMYIVEQLRGMNYRVNESHILSLRETVPALYSQPIKNGKRFIDKSKLIREQVLKTTNIKLSDYINKNNSFKNLTKGYKCKGIDFPHSEVLLPPYYLGLWLGDGRTNDITEIATIDKPIEDYLINNYGIKNTYGPENIAKRIYPDVIRPLFRKTYNTKERGLPPGTKYIPDNYLYNNKEVRLQVLAGLIDSDGTYCKHNKQYIFSNINKTLVEQLMYITRSLGFYTSMTIHPARISKRGLNEQELYVVRFIPECDIPVLLDRKKQVIKSNFKDRLVTAINIKKDIIDNYYGFELDGDHLFMLKDFTVTHNTGNFSLDSTFNSSVQGLGLRHITTDLKIGDLHTTGDLSNIYTLRSQKILESVNGDINKLSDEVRKTIKYKSDIIKGAQSSSVDNEKAQIMDKLNMNNETFDCIRALHQLGFEEKDVSALLTQDIIWEYTKAIKSASSSLVEYSSNKLALLEDKIIKKYDPSGRYAALSTDERKELMSTATDVLYKNLETPQFVEVPIGERTPDSNLLQLALLDRFKDLSSIGKDIKLVQSAINTRSSGLPKNLLETSDKVDQINGLKKSNIINAEKLLGIYSESDELVEPTTINGFAAHFGAQFANTLYGKYFPYTEVGFDKQVREISSHVFGDDKPSKSQLTKLKVEVFQATKSYLFTKKDTKLYGDSIEAERKRIFISTNKNKSLASILKGFENQAWFKKNEFLNRLMLKPRGDGFISKVEFNASAGENYDERAIHLGLLYLLESEDALGTINGKEYTKRSLAQDLISYAYLEGGKQGSKQFIKYIPIEYLKTIGFGNALSNVDFDFSNTFGGVNSFMDESTFTTPSIFTKQFFQNNPGKAPKIELENVTLLKNNNVVIKDEFKKLYTKTETIEGNYITVPLQFASIDGNLYQYDNSIKEYIKIPILNDKYGFVQYNYKNDVKHSVTEKVKEPVKVVEIVDPRYIISEKEASPLNKFEFNANEAVINNPIDTIATLEINRKLHGEAMVQDLLSKIQGSNALPYYKQLAKKFQSLDLPQGFKFNFIQSADYKGSYDSSTRTLEIRTDYLTDVNSLAEVLIHELTHAHTSEVIKKYLNNDPLTSTQKALVSRLEGLRSKYEKTLDPTLFHDFKERQTTGDVTLNEREKYYGATKLEEFVSMAMTDPVFQRYLNDTIDSDGASLLDKLLSYLVDILDTIGIKVKDNSLLKSALIDINNLIDSNQEINLEKEVVNKAQVESKEINVSENPFVFPKGTNFNPTDFLPSVNEIEELRRICK